MLRATELDHARFDDYLAGKGLEDLRRMQVTTIQLNIGLRCNLACHHCHVESGPNRTERIDRRGIERVLRLLEINPQVKTLDITGGAPELHEDFRLLVRGARRLGRRVIDRCNLTVFFEPGQQDTADFLAEQGVEIVASLPCHSLENVEQQRGRGVFGASIEALRKPRPHLQPGRRFSATGSGTARSRVPPRAQGEFRDRVQPAAHDHEHADQTLCP